MRAPPSIIVSILLLCSAALVSARTVGDGESTDGATTATIIYNIDNSATLYLPDKSTIPYIGGEIVGADQVTVFGTFGKDVLNLGTLIRTNGVPFSLASAPTTNGGVLTLAAGSNFVTGGTLALGAGSTVSFDGQLNSNSELSINSGATLVANDLSRIESGVNVQVNGVTTLTTAGTLTLGAGSIINSSGTLTLGSDATVNNGVVTFGGTGGTIATGGLLTLSAGSTLANNATLTLAGNTAYTGSTTISGGVLTLNGNTGAGISVITVAPGGLPGLLMGPLTTTGNLVFTSATTLGITANVASFNAPFTVTGSTPLNLNLASGILLNRLPTFRGSALTTGGTAIKFLDGVLTGGGSISLLYLPAVQNLVSDPVSIHISEYDTPGVHDKYVLQLSYAPVAAAALGDVLNLYLGWFDPSDSTWKNAVDGNSDGGTSAHFVAGAYDPTVDFNLGYYGVDAANSTVWAVVDHNSEFGVATPAPEPSAGALLACGLALLGRRARKP